MVRAPCCEKMGLKKGPWTPEEDQILINYIQLNGHGNWRKLPKEAGLLRCGKSCRLRWINYLRPDIRRGNFSQEEEGMIIRLHQMLGNRWSAIAAKLPGRTDNEIKNVWHTHLKKRLLKQEGNSCNASSSPNEAIQVESKKSDQEVKVSSGNTISENSWSVSSTITLSSDDNNNSTTNVTDYEENNSFDGIKNEDFWSEVLSANDYSISVEGFDGVEFQPIHSPPLLPVSTEVEYNWVTQEHESNEIMDYCCDLFTNYDLFTKAADEFRYPSNF